jgi:hypothetical protein
VALLEQGAAPALLCNEAFIYIKRILARSEQGYNEILIRIGATTAQTVSIDSDPTKLM